MDKSAEFKDIVPQPSLHLHADYCAALRRLWLFAIRWTVACQTVAFVHGISLAADWDIQILIPEPF